MTNISRVVAAVICDSVKEKHKIFAAARSYGEFKGQCFQLSMDCFWCETITEKLVLKEAEAAKWLSKDELDSVQWIPVDLILIKKIRNEMEGA